MAGVYDSLFGPLSKDYCNVFLFLSFFTFFIFVSTIFGAVLLILSKKGKFEWYLGIIYGILVSGLQYIIFRLLYNMCKK
jgi:hypothetical protein